MTVKILEGVDDGTGSDYLEKVRQAQKVELAVICTLLFLLIITTFLKDLKENLYYELPIAFSDAALGTTVEVPSIDGGKSKIKIPAGTISQETI